MTMMMMALLALLVSSLPCLVSAAADVSFNTTTTKIAFGSCHKNKYAKTLTPNIWASITSLNPDVFVWTGDAVYPSTRRGVASLSSLENEYQVLLKNASLGYADFLPPHGIYGTWDDHDYGVNDGGKWVSEKDERSNLFLDFLGYSIPEQRKGVYHSVDLGSPPHQIKLLLLDTRYHRDNHCIPSVASSGLPLGAGLACLARWFTAGMNLCKDTSQKTLLGNEQWIWLQQELSTSQAQIHLIISSIQVLTTNPVMESWGHYPSEQASLVEMLNGVSSPILLSGDVHHAEVLTMQNLVEVTSSGLTHTCSQPRLYGHLCEPLLQKFVQHRANASDYFIGRNFGMLHVDWDTREWLVQVHDAQAKEVLTTGWRPIEVMSVDSSQVAQVIDGHLIPYVIKLVWPVVVCTLVLAAVLIVSRRPKKAKQS